MFQCPENEGLEEEDLLRITVMTPRGQSSLQVNVSHGGLLTACSDWIWNTSEKHKNSMFLRRKGIQWIDQETVKQQERFNFFLPLTFSPDVPASGLHLGISLEVPCCTSCTRFGSDSELVEEQCSALHVSVSDVLVKDYICCLTPRDKDKTLNRTETPCLYSSNSLKDSLVSLIKQFQEELSYKIKNKWNKKMWN